MKYEVLSKKYCTENSENFVKYTLDDEDVVIVTEEQTERIIETYERLTFVSERGRVFEPIFARKNFIVAFRSVEKEGERIAATNI